MYSCGRIYRSTCTPRSNRKGAGSVRAFSLFAGSRGRILRFMRKFPSVVLIVALAVPCMIPVSSLAQTASVDGEWTVDLTLPMGDVTFTMVIEQKAGVLTGHMVNEIGQFDVSGAINRDQVKIQWSFPDGGKTLDVTFNGK